MLLTTAVPRRGRPARQAAGRPRPRQDHRRGHLGRAEDPAGQRRCSRSASPATGDALRRRALLADLSATPATSRATVLEMTVDNGPAVTADALRRIDAAGITLTRARPARAEPRRRLLDLTGHKAEDETVGDATAPASMKGTSRDDRRPCARRPQLPPAASSTSGRCAGPSATCFTIARRNLLALFRTPVALVFIVHPADHVRAAVSLRLRRRRSTSRATPTSTTCFRASWSRPRSSARSAPPSASPRTSRRASSSGSARCRWRAWRCSPDAPWPDPARNVIVLDHHHGRRLPRRLSPDAVGLHLSPGLSLDAALRLLPLVGLRLRRTGRPRTPRPPRP